MILHLSQLDQQGSYTYSEYLKWRFDELVELIKGRLYPMSAPLSRHQRIVGSIYRDIATYLKRKKCQVFVAPFDVRLPRFDANGQLMEDVNTVV